MIYLLYGSNAPALQRYLADLFIKHPQWTRKVLDDFKETQSTRKELLQSDSLFGEEIAFVLNNYPKSKLNLLKETLALKQNLHLILCYYGEDLSLESVVSWVKTQSGENHEFKDFGGRAVFKFLDGFSARNLRTTLSALRDLAAQKENVFLVLSYFFTRIEKLIAAKEDVNSRLKKAAEGFSLKDLLRFQENIVSLEIKLKSESVDEWEELETWLIQSFQKKS